MLRVNPAMAQEGHDHGGGCHGLCGAHTHLCRQSNHTDQPCRQERGKTAFSPDSYCTLIFHQRQSYYCQAPLFALNSGQRGLLVVGRPCRQPTALLGWVRPVRHFSALETRNKQSNVLRGTYPWAQAGEPHTPQPQSTHTFTPPHNFICTHTHKFNLEVGYSQTSPFISS